MHHQSLQAVHIHSMDAPIPEAHPLNMLQIRVFLQPIVYPMHLLAYTVPMLFPNDISELFVA